MANISDSKNQISILVDDLEINERFNKYGQEEETLFSLEKRKRVCTKKSLIGKYYWYLLHKEPLIFLLILGGVIGCILSISIVSERWYLWWWIPLSTLVIGPIGLVIFVLILPFIPVIIYIMLRIIIELN